MTLQDTFYIARIKKPHRKFATGDIVIGIINDGAAERMICSGWSSKFNTFIDLISLHYQGWNGWRNNPNERLHQRSTRSGHLVIVNSVIERNILLHELSYVSSEIKSHADFVRQLSLFGGNLSEMVEAAATRQTK